MRRPPASPSSHTPSSFNASLASCVPSAPRLGICLHPAPRLGSCLHQYNFVSSLLYSYERTRHTTSRLCCGALFPLHFSNSRPPHPHPCLPLSPLFTDRYFVGLRRAKRVVCVPGAMQATLHYYIISFSASRSPPPPQHTHSLAFGFDAVVVFGWSSGADG